MKLKEAVKIARNCAAHSSMRHKLGAVIFDNKFHATGYNRSYNTHYKDSIHAEEDAIKNANRIGINFEKSTLVVVRINNKGDFLCSFPCSKCQKLIKQMKIPTTYFIS